VGKITKIVFRREAGIDGLETMGDEIDENQKVNDVGGRKENQGPTGAFNQIKPGRDDGESKTKKEVDLPPLPWECQPGARWRWRWRCARRRQA
jgi:hypothetical protein